MIQNSRYEDQRAKHTFYETANRAEEGGARLLRKLNNNKRELDVAGHVTALVPIVRNSNERFSPFIDFLRKCRVTTGSSDPPRQERINYLRACFHE